MTRKLNLIITTAIASFFPLAAADAQQQPQTRMVKFRAICFQHVGGIQKLHAVLPGENPRAVEFELFTTTFSDEVDLPVAGNRIHFAVPEDSGGATPNFRVVASARAVTGPRQLAIFVPGPNEETPYQVFIVDDSLQNFPMGSTMAVNLAPAPFQFNIGEHIKAVAPGRIEKIPMARQTNDRGQVNVIISIADPENDGQWRAVNQTRWFSGTDKRDLVISFIHPVTNQPTVHSYADSPGFSRG
jgi:hypothetical protein